MTNHQIASIFIDIADRLDLEGANSYRIRAYRRAAETLERLEVPAADLARRGRLTELPGIGRELERKIRDLLTTGKIQEEPEEQSAASPRENASIPLPGLDPKLSRLFQERYHIETLDDLERLARSRLLRTLPGIGIRLERRILTELKTLREIKSPEGP